LVNRVFNTTYYARFLNHVFLQFDVLVMRNDNAISQLLQGGIY
jgi:hypothetical protein